MKPRSQDWRLRQAIECLLLAIVLWVSFHPPAAIAEIRMSEHIPGQLLIQSRHNLRDDGGNYWNAILFRQMQADGGLFRQMQADGGDRVILRLVGFPGVTEFARSQPLEITARRGQFWVANDLYAQNSPAVNVAQYDMKNILPQLPKFGKVRLDFQLSADRHVEMVTPGNGCRSRFCHGNFSIETLKICDIVMDNDKNIDKILSLDRRLDRIFLSTQKPLFFVFF